MTLKGLLEKAHRLGEPPAWAIVIIAYLVLSIRLLTFVISNSPNILFWDQWDFYDPIFKHQGFMATFNYVHGPMYKMGIGLVLTDWLNQVTHWSTTGLYVAVALCFITSSILAIIFKVRVTGVLGALDWMIPLLFLNLFQYETYVISSDISSTTLPLLFLMIIALLMTYNEKPKAAVNLSILGISLLSMFTGYGYVVTLTVVVYYFVRIVLGPARIWQGLCFAASLATVGSYFIGYRPDEMGHAHASLSVYAKYAVLLIDNFFGHTAHSAGLLVMPVLLLFGFIWLFVTAMGQKRFNAELPLLALYAFALIYVLGNTYGRASLGLSNAQSSRYVTLLIPAYFALYVQLFRLAITETGKVRVAMPVLLALSLGYVAVSWVHDPHSISDAQAWTVRRENWKDCYLKLGDIDRCDTQTGFNIYPKSGEAATGLKAKLDFLKANHLSLFN